MGVRDPTLHLSKHARLAKEGQRGSILSECCDLVDSPGGRKGIVRELSLIVEWRPSCSGVGDR